MNQLLVAAISALIVVNSFVDAVSAQDSEAKSYPVLSGVGLALQARDGHIFAAKIVPKSPADKSGLIKEGSRLVSVEVDGETISLDGKTIGDAASLIRGPVGTQIVLTVAPPDGGTATRVALVREPLEIAGVPDSTYKTLIGKSIGDLRLSSLDGSSQTKLSDYRGRVVVLDFWASWCPTCYAPVAKMQKLPEEHPEWAGKVELLTVTVDSEPSKAAEVIKAQKWDRTRNCAVDLEELKGIGVTVVPVIIIVAPDGTIATMAGAHAIDTEKEVAALLAK